MQLPDLTVTDRDSFVAAYRAGCVAARQHSAGDELHEKDSDTGYND